MEGFVFDLQRFGDYDWPNILSVNNANFPGNGTACFYNASEVSSGVYTVDQGTTYNDQYKGGDEIVVSASPGIKKFIYFISVGGYKKILIKAYL